MTKFTPFKAAASGTQASYWRKNNYIGADGNRENTKERKREMKSKNNIESNSISRFRTFAFSRSSLWFARMIRCHVILATTAYFFLVATITTATEPPAREPLSQVRAAGIVLKWLRKEKEANYARAEKLIETAAKGGAKLVCTTECFLDGYAIKDKSIPLDEYRALGESIPDGQFYQRLAKLADRLDIYVIAGLLEADGEHRYNTAVFLAPDGQLIGKYRKHKLEHELVRNTPGTETPIFQTPVGNIGIMICADRRDPDLVKRFKDAGAQILICPSGGMFGPKSNDTIVQARSKENGVPILFVHPAEFLVTDAKGEIQARELLGNQLEIENGEIGSATDSNSVYYFDLLVAKKQ